MDGEVYVPRKKHMQIEVCEERECRVDSLYSNNILLGHFFGRIKYKNKKWQGSEFSDRGYHLRLVVFFR